VNRFTDFLKSDVGMLARYRKRKRNRVYIDIVGIEPQSKKMPAGEQDKFQAAIAEKLISEKRSTFRGNVALKLDLVTTSRNAPHAHTIAKNLLDLLGERRPDVKWARKYLLYKDDRQIQVLSVSCRHGGRDPIICVEAMPLAAMLDDLALAAKAVQENEMRIDALHREDRDREWIKTLRDLKQNDADTRRQLGDDTYDAYLKMVRWNAQKALLGRSAVTIPVLTWMYGLPKGIPTGFEEVEWAKLVGASKLRLQVGELPIASGGSDVFKQNVMTEIQAFKQRWDWIINPLVVAVALEVIVRPNPATPTAVLHDLDNIVRDYLLPGIVPSFGTVSDHRWTIDFKELERTNPELAASWGANPTPPSGTKGGVTRYEVWRLPAVVGEPGFVSVALVADMDARGDLMYQIDENISTWATSNGRDKRHW